MRVAIIDDEPLARKKLRAMIERFEGLELVGEALNATQAINLINDQKPDLVFLDIRMPSGSGIDVLREAAFIPQVIFATAYDSYAVTAFELGAVDYLLKPFGRDRFRRAVERVIKKRQSGEDVSERVASLSDALLHESRLRRLFVREGDEIRRVLINDIVHFQGQDDYVLVHALGRRHIVKVRLKEFDRRLDPDKFVRVHRSHIINLDCIDNLVSLGDGRYRVGLNNGISISTSRRGGKILRQYVSRSGSS